MKLNKDRTSYNRTSKDPVDISIDWYNDFYDFMMNKKCLSLAAPEVNAFIRVIGVKNFNRKKATIMASPIIVKQSKKIKPSTEHCLIPGATHELHKQRPTWVRVQYLDPFNGKTKKKTYRKRFAAAVCHTIEILDGTLFKS